MVLFQKTSPEDERCSKEDEKEPVSGTVPDVLLDTSKNWESLDEMERRFMNKVSLAEDDADKMEFELRILKSEIINMRKQNRKHASQIRKWNLNELREEVYKLSEQQELIERAMLQDHVS